MSTNQDSNTGTSAYFRNPTWREHVRGLFRWLLQARYRHQEVSQPHKVEVRRSYPTGSARIACGIPDVIPVYAKDAIISRVDVHLSFVDRLKVLLGCVVHVGIVTYTEELPGAVKSETQAYPYLP